MEPIIFRLRDWFRSESLAITIPVGVVILLAVRGVLASLVGAFIWPIVAKPFEDDPFDPFSDVTIFGVKFLWNAPLIELLSFALLAGLVYWVFVREIEEDEPGAATRPCPECKSDIVAEATRCAFCTAVVTPVVTGEPS